MFRVIHTQRRRFGVVPFNLFDVGEGIAEVEVLQWFVKEGDKIEEFDKVCEVQSDKASVEISSRYTGKVTELNHKVGDIAKVGEPLMHIDVEGKKDEVQTESKPKDEEKPIAEPTPQEHDKQEVVQEKYMDETKFIATPAVRRLLKEHKIDIEDINGTGKDGRVLKGDVLVHLEDKYQNNPNKQNMTPVQKIMAETMTRSLQVPHFHYTQNFDISMQMRYRTALQSFMGSKLSFMPLFIKAFSNSLMQYPILNAVYETETYINHRDEHNVGIAMDTPNGLLVPTIKSVQRKTVMDIANELDELIQKGKNNKLSPNDMKDCTVTLSNIGSIGNCVSANPILPPGNSIIGAICSIQKEHMTMPISWGADHRIVDGATLARFSNTFQDFLNKPL